MAVKAIDLMGSVDFYNWSSQTSWSMTEEFPTKWNNPTPIVEPRNSSLSQEENAEVEDNKEGSSLVIAFYGAHQSSTLIN